MLTAWFLNNPMKRGVVKTMKARVLAIFGLIFIFGPTGFGQRLYNPAGLSTVPPSSIRSGLVESRNPIDNSGNLVVTGNVRGGRHFRGVIPYNSRTRFEASLGSSALDSFLRYSADWGDFGGYTGEVRPFYSRSATVVTTRAGQPRVYRPSNGRIIGGRTMEGATTASVSGEESFLAGDSMYKSEEADLARFRLIPVSPPTETTKLLPDIVDLARNKDLLEIVPASEREKAAEKLLIDEIRSGDTRSRALLKEGREGLAGAEQFRQQLKQISLKMDYGKELMRKQEGFMDDGEAEKTAEFRGLEELTRKDEPLQGRGEEEVQRDMLEQADIALTGREGQESTFGSFLQKYKERGLRTEGPKPAVEVKGAKKSGLFEGGLLPKTADRGVAAVEERAGAGGVGSVLQGSDVPGRYELVGQQGGVEAEPEDSGLLLGGGATVEQKAGYRTRAKAIMGSHTSFQSFSESKFKECMNAGAAYLKEGKFYRAADAYSLASVYEPGSAVVNAGKSHSLLGAGEYMSSALFISRALEGAGGEKRAGMSALALFASSFSLLDRDTVEKRISDIERWHQASGASELEFLLAYVYYQMGRLERAKAAIETAYEEMADVPAVIILKQAIDSHE